MNETQQQIRSATQLGEPLIQHLAHLPREQRSDLARTLREKEQSDPRWLRRLIDEHLRNARFFWQLFPDVLSTLERLHRRFHLGIITNGMTEIQRNKIQRLGIEPYFDTAAVITVLRPAIEAGGKQIASLLGG